MKLLIFIKAQGYDTIRSKKKLTILNYNDFKLPETILVSQFKLIT